MLAAGQPARIENRSKSQNPQSSISKFQICLTMTGPTLASCCSDLLLTCYVVSKIPDRFNKMGKKSKKKTSDAKPNAEAASAAMPSGASETVGVGAGSKNKCVRCFCNLKDTSKAHICPGCTLLYCWRCEKKCFAKCPNGKSCASASNAKRCCICYEGQSFDKLVEECGDAGGDIDPSIPRERRLDLFSGCIASGAINDFTSEVIPFQSCGADDCTAHEVECYACLKDTHPRSLVHCVTCSRIRCHSCKNKESKDGLIRPGVFRAFENLERVSSKEIISIASYVRARSPDAWVCCIECGSCFCYGCLDDKSAESLAVTIVEGLRLIDSGGDLYSLKQLFKCSDCYWKSKPCTNPSCTNEVGVPTKRCGGCHLDRYCSVECQAAAYPDHVGRCKRIQNKRAAPVEKKAA